MLDKLAAIKYTRSQTIQDYSKNLTKEVRNSDFIEGNIEETVLHMPEA